MDLLEFVQFQQQSAFEGIGVFMQPGALPEEALKDLITKLQDLDMVEVRAELESRTDEDSA